MAGVRSNVGDLLEVNNMNGRHMLGYLGRSTCGRRPHFAAVVLLALAAAGLNAQEQPVAQTGSIRSPRPLLDLARMMEQLYASPVTYEDPIWEFQGDLAPLGPEGRSFPLYRTFVVPPELTPTNRPKLDSAVLREALAAYHSQTDGPRFKIATSRLGLHLVPDQVRRADGNLAPARNALDAVLSMPITLASPSQHLMNLCAELSAATGARIVFAAPSGNYRLEQIYMPNGHNGRIGSREDLTVAWGAEGITAREALINLLEPSATTLGWHFICQAGPACFIQVDALKLGVAMPNGQTGWKAMLYDRCTVNCPKLVHPPAPIKR
jgi:hypothetical protein